MGTFMALTAVVLMTVVLAPMVLVAVAFSLHRARLLGGVLGVSGSRSRLLVGGLNGWLDLRLGEKEGPVGDLVAQKLMMSALVVVGVMRRLGVIAAFALLQVSKARLELVADDVIAGVESDGAQ